MDSASRQRARVPHRPAKRRMHGRRYYTWAELLRRVDAVGILTCPRCGGVRRLPGRCGERCVYGWDFGRDNRFGRCQTGGLTGCRWGGILAESGSGAPNRSLNYLHPRGFSWIGVPIPIDTRNPACILTKLQSVPGSTRRPKSMVSAFPQLRCGWPSPAPHARRGRGAGNRKGCTTGVRGSPISSP